MRIPPEGLNTVFSSPFWRGWGAILELPLGLPELGNVVMRLFPHAVLPHGCGLGRSSRQQVNVPDLIWIHGGLTDSIGGGRC